jgi:hypothetical protein
MKKHLHRCPGCTYVIRFVNLFDEGRALAFPCNDAGVVDLDAMSERARRNYLFARAMVGRDFSPPQLDALRDESAQARGS